MPGQSNALASSSSNFALLSDFASIPESKPTPTSFASGTQPTGTQSILDRVTQISQQQIKPRLNHIDEAVIKGILNSPFPPDQLRNKNRTHAAARCCANKNRQQAAVPFDDNRVRLRGVNNDYINCTRVVTSTSELPVALVAESPLAENYEDAWRLIWDEQVELVVFIASPTEVTDQRLMAWHQRDSSKAFPAFDLVVDSKIAFRDDQFASYTIILSKANQKRCMTVFEVTDWNEHVQYPPQNLAKIVTTIGKRFLEQKSVSQPPLVISASGSGRCGAFLLLFVIALVEQNRKQAGSSGPSALQIYSTLQNSRNLLIQSKIAIPALSMFNFYNSFV